MARCSAVVDLIITRDVEGTSTEVARERVAVGCELELNHDGAHSSTDRDVNWEPGQKTIVRHGD